MTDLQIPAVPPGDGMTPGMRDLIERARNTQAAVDALGAGRPAMRVRVYDQDTGTTEDVTLDEARQRAAALRVVDVIQQPGETVAAAMARAQAVADANGHGPIAWAPASDETDPAEDDVPWCEPCQAWHDVDNHPGRACYQPPQPPPATIPQPRPDRPVLLHSGNYALYLTPKGEFHLVYQRTAGTHPETGEVLAIDGAPQVHMRDLPEKAANLVAAVMDRDTPLPPMISAMLMEGKAPSLRAMLAMMKEFAGADLEAMMTDGGENAANME